MTSEALDPNKLGREFLSPQPQNVEGDAEEVKIVSLKEYFVLSEE
jgi:hypothetical protein